MSEQILSLSKITAWLDWAHYITPQELVRADVEFRNDGECWEV